MSRGQLEVTRGENGSHETEAMSGARNQAHEDQPSVHPLTVLRVASSLRLEDPRREHERVVMIEVAIVAGREAARTLDRWLSQSLAEYRGSRTSWDLEATTAELRLKLARFDHTLHTTAKRLLTLVPELSDEAAALDDVTDAVGDDHLFLGEIAAASGLLRSVMEHSSVGRPVAASTAVE
jgi:hypothetical protein